MTRTTARFAFLACLLLAGPATAQSLPDLEAHCGTNTALDKGGGLRTLSASDPYVEARIVFVAFPNHAQGLPVWADSMAAELSDYVAVMSRGAQTLHLSVLRRTDVPTDAWVADSVADYYAAGPGYGALNSEIMNKIAAQQPSAWNGVEQVFMIHYQCTFPCPPPGTEQNCESNCYYGGIASLGFYGGVPGFTGGGTTTRFYFPMVSEPLNHQIQLNFAGHEYGHILGFGHAPGSDTPDPNFANMGRFDLMRSGNNAGCQRPDGLVPYATGELANAGWLPVSTITTDTRNLHIPDGRAANATAIRVDLPGVSPPQAFLIENHRSGSTYDSKLAGTGLAIWHLVNPSGYSYANFWDLESAQGKFTSGSPDPVSGKDSLEADKYYCGSGNDLWDGVNHTNFSVATNPNTNGYAAPAYYITYAQNVPTTIGIENIRRDPNSTDMIVDVYVTPKQFVTAPNGGETFEAGAPVTVTWQTRPYASIANVDVLLSSDAGGSWTTLASAIANTGTYSWTPTASGQQYRVRVVSHDTHGFTGSDDSDANFSVTVSGHWVSLPGVGTARKQAAAAFDAARQRTLLFGGTNGSVCYNDVYALSSTDSWSALSTSGTPPSARRRAGMIYDVARDRLVVFGGYSNPSSLSPKLNDLYQLDLSTNTWSALSAGSPPSPILYETQAVYDPVRDRLIAIEGTGIVWAYPLAGGSWTMLCAGGLGNEGYDHFSAAYDSLKDEIVVFGGWIDGPNPDLDNLNGVGVFPLSGAGANTWQDNVAGGTPPARRALTSLIYEPVRDRAVAFGGEQFQTQANTHYNDAWQVGLSGAPTWYPLAPTGPGPGVRSGHIATYDRRFDRMIVAGGTDGTNLLGDSWALSWDQIAPAQVTDLTPTVGCEHISFSWTVPGDDGTVGQSIAYDLRRSGSVITEATWSGCTSVASGACSASGAAQDPIVDLVLGPCSTRYYYALKVRDDGYNWSPLSNVTSRIGTPCPRPPAQCYDAAIALNAPPRIMEFALDGANPTRSPVAVSYGIPTSMAGTTYRIAVFDLAGRRVQTLASGTAQAGRGTLAWDLTSESGARVRSGMYYVRFQLGDKAITRPIVTVR